MPYIKVLIPGKTSNKTNKQEKTNRRETETILSKATNYRIRFIDNSHAYIVSF
jgi:hypothetical protein